MAKTRISQVDQSSTKSRSKLETKAGNHAYEIPYPNGFFTLEGLGEGTWSALSYDQSASLGYIRNPIAHRCIRLICEAMGSLDLVTHESGEEFSEHPLLDLMRYPNDQQGGAEFLQSLIGYYLVSGEAFVHASLGSDGKASQLFTLRPDCVKKLVSADGWVGAFEYSSGTGTNSVRSVYMNGKWDEDIGSLLHLSSFNPLDQTKGLSPLQSAQSALRIHNAASGWNLALLKNSARPSGALVFAPRDGGNLTDDQFSRLKSELEANYTGARAAGRPLVLEGGLDWKAMGYSPKDMDFIEAKQAAAREIALALGVPPMLLGLPGDNTYSNYQEANRAFYRLTVLPLATRVVGAIADWLSDFSGERVELRPDLDQIPALSMERDAQWRSVADATFLTAAEKRSLLGLPAVEVGDGG